MNKRARSHSREGVYFYWPSDDGDEPEPKRPRLAPARQAWQAWHRACADYVDALSDAANVAMQDHPTNYKLTFVSDDLIALFPELADASIRVLSNIMHAFAAEAHHMGYDVCEGREGDFPSATIYYD